MSFFQAAALLCALASTATAHGTVSGIIANGQYHQGYSPSMQFLNPVPVVVGWSIPEDIEIGPIYPDAYTNPDIICHKGATNAGTHAEVAAGSGVQLQWTPWPESHHGPVVDYLAACNGACETVDKTKLEWFKIDGVGLLDDSSLPGKWASDQLIAANNSWTVTIPATIAPGNYTLRHEIIALHNANNAGGAQNYPQCINLAVTGSGTDVPAGTLGTALYNPNDAGIFVDIYNPLSSYTIPGPTPYSASPGTRIAAQTSSVIVAPTFVSSTPASAPSTAASSSTPASVSESYASATAPVAASSSVSGLTTSAALSFTIPTDMPASTAAASSPAVPASSSVSSSTSSSSSSTTPSYVAPSGTAPMSTATSSSTGASSPTAPTAPTALFPSSTISTTPSATSSVTDALPTDPSPTDILPTSLPSSVATEPLPTALPTGNLFSSPVPMPHKPLPAGTTYQDFMDWVAYVKAVFARTHGGKHPRDLGAK